MLSEKILQRCFAHRLAEAESQWLRALSIADHAYRQDFIDQNSGCKLLSTTLGGGHHDKRVVLMTSGGITERLLLHALCLYALIIPFDPFTEQHTDTIFLHGLSKHRWQWPVFPKIADAPSHFQLDILQAAQEHLLDKQSQRQNSVTDSVYSTELLQQVCLSLFADASQVVVIDLRTSLKENNLLGLQSVFSPAKDSPWPLATEQIGESIERAGYDYFPNLAHYCPNSQVQHLVLDIGISPSVQLLKSREQKGSQECFTEAFSIPTDLSWRKNFLYQAWSVLGQVQEILRQIG